MPQNLEMIFKYANFVWKNGYFRHIQERCFA